MKTSKFFLSTLVAAAAMTANAYAGTTVGDTTYSGSIYTWANTGTTESDLAYGGWQLSTYADGAYSYGDSITEWSGSINGLIASTASGTGDFNTIRFDSTVGSNGSMKYTFAPFSIAGIIVESGTTGFKIVAPSTDSDRSIYLGNNNATAAYSTILEDFSIDNSASSNTENSINIRGTQTWTIGTGKTFSLTSDKINISGAFTVNGGTVSLSGPVDFTSDFTSTTFNEETAGLQNVTETFTLYSGTGTVSGLSTDNLTVNGSAVSSVSGNTATKNVSVYNILAGSEVNYTDEGVSTANRLNVLGTLNRGIINGAAGENIVGTGTVKMESQLDGHGASLAFSDDFTGTVEFTGKLNTGSTSLSKDATLKLYNYGTTTSSLWGGGTLSSKVVFATNYQIGDSTDTTIGFSGSVTGNTGTTVTITGNATANFSGTTTFDTLNTSGTANFSGATTVTTLNASGTIGLNGATSVTTMNVATGKTLNLNGVHNLTATSVVLNEGATLALGNLSNNQNVNLSGLTGTGTISVSKTSGNHSHTVDLGTKFAGTIELKGYFNPTTLTLGSSEGTVKLNGVWFWGGAQTFNKAVEFVNKEDVIVGSGSSGKNYSTGDMTFNEGATFKEGAKFQIAGTTTNWGTLKLEQNAQATMASVKIAAWGSLGYGNKTLQLEDGATLTVSGEMVNDSGLTLTNNGGITAQTAAYKTSGDWNTNTFSGDGYIVAEKLLVGNYTKLVLQNHKFVIGELEVQEYSAVRLGTATIGATKDWSSDVAMALTDSTETGATTTTFNTGVFDKETDTFSSATGHAISLGGALSGNGALVKDGAGTLTLSGANTYSGGTTISAGTLVAENANALGSGNVKVESDATLSLNTATLSVKNLSGEGKIMLAKDTTKDAVLTVTSDEDTTFSGTITTGVFNDANNEYSVGLTKEGAGMLTLTAETGFSGGEVKINEGTLYAGSSGVLADSSVSVAGGASLRVAPNSGVYGVYANSFTFNENAQLLVDLGTLVMPASTEGATTDSITLDVLVSSAIKFGDTTLVAGDAINLPENYVSLENASAFDEWTKTWSYTDGTLSLTMAIPEPSMFGLLAGLGALALVGTRRRRR